MPTWLIWVIVIVVVVVIVALLSSLTGQAPDRAAPRPRRRAAPRGVDPGCRADGVATRRPRSCAPRPTWPGRGERGRGAGGDRRAGPPGRAGRLRGQAARGGPARPRGRPQVDRLRARRVERRADGDVGSRSPADAAPSASTEETAGHGPHQTGDDHGCTADRGPRGRGRATPTSQWSPRKTTWRPGRPRRPVGASPAWVRCRQRRGRCGCCASWPASPSRCRWTGSPGRAGCRAPRRTTC